MRLTISVLYGVLFQSMNPIIHVSSVKEKFGIRELQRQMISMTGLLMSK